MYISNNIYVYVIYSIFYIVPGVRLDEIPSFLSFFLPLVGKSVVADNIAIGDLT